MLYATDAAAEDEDPVIDPDGCAWIAGGLERFVEGHRAYGDLVTFDTRGDGDARGGGRRAAGRAAAALAGPPAGGAARRAGNAPHWSFARTELAVLAGFYRRCADRGFAVFADY